MEKKKYKKVSESPSLKRAQDKYNRSTDRITVRFTKQEKELYKFVKTKKNMGEYIKNLIKQDYVK